MSDVQANLQRTELLRARTAELPRLVDRVLDHRPAAAGANEVRPAVPLFAAFRRALGLSSN